jgi:hypothetical protein
MKNNNLVSENFYGKGVPCVSPFRNRHTPTVRKNPLFHAFHKPIPRFGLIRRATAINVVGQKSGRWRSLILEVTFVLSVVCVANLQHIRQCYMKTST